MTLSFVLFSRIMRAVRILHARRILLPIDQNRGLTKRVRTRPLENHRYAWMTL